MKMHCLLVALIATLTYFQPVSAFNPAARPLIGISSKSQPLAPRPLTIVQNRFDENTENVEDAPYATFNAIQSDELVLGASGTVAALVVFYSEYILSQTGCGLPAGPGGIVGAIEGLSYLEIAGIVVLSVTSKITDGSGLPAGKFNLLGLAEGLSYLAVLAGVGVLGFQLINYGYIPNAVPVEGGMCH